MKSEVKIGVFLTIGLLIVATFIFIVGDLSTLFKGPGYEVSLYFDSAAGLEKRTGVRLAGVKIGYVKDIRLKGNQAEVVLSINPKIQLRTDAQATLAALGLLGEKYIEILPGIASEYVAPGGSIGVVPPVGLDQLGAELASVGSEIRETGQLLRDMLGSEESQTSIKVILQNLADFASDLREFTEANKQSLKMSIQKSSDAIGNFDERVTEVSRNLEELISSLQAMVDENRDNVRINLENIKEVIGKAEKSLDTLDQTLTKINEGEGTLGKLIQDQELYDEAEKTMGEIQRAVEPVSKFRAKGSLHFEYYSDPDLLKSYLTLTLLPASDTFILAQVVQDPFLNDFTYSLQGGLRWNEIAGRAGILESKVGAAIDVYALKDHLKFSLEAYDFNRKDYPYFRLFASYSPVKYIYLLFGLNDFALAEKRELFFGLGLGI